MFFRYEVDEDFRVLKVTSLVAFTSFHYMQIKDYYHSQFGESNPSFHALGEYQLLAYQSWRFPSRGKQVLLLPEAPKANGRHRWLAKSSFGLHVVEPLDRGRPVWAVGNPQLAEDEVDISSGEYVVDSPISLLVAYGTSLADLAKVVNDLAFLYRQPVTIHLRVRQEEPQDPVARALQSLAQQPFETDKENEYA